MLDDTKITFVDNKIVIPPTAERQVSFVRKNTNNCLSCHTNGGPLSFEKSEEFGPIQKSPGSHDSKYFDQSNDSLNSLPPSQAPILDAVINPSDRTLPFLVFPNSKEN